jgi:phospholipid transport system substrate-binding protein
MRAPHVLAALTLLTSALAAGPARAGDAAVELQRQADRVVTILADRGTEPAARQREVRAIVCEAFDFEEAAKRTLGRAWAERTAEERAAFVGLFTDLIDRAYLRRLDAWDGQRIVVGDDVVDTDRATVRTAIVARDGDTTPVDYVMRRSDEGRWRVVDVNVGGASLLGNYRVQFARLMQTGGFPHLMERLQAKVTSLQP